MVVRIKSGGPFPGQACCWWILTVGYDAVTAVIDATFCKRDIQNDLATYDAMG